MKVNIKVYTENGEKHFIQDVDFNLIKFNVVKTNYDGTYTMKNGDVVEIIK